VSYGTCGTISTRFDLDAESNEFHRSYKLGQNVP